MSKGTILRLQHESRVLENNPAGDPHIRDLYVYLPPGYEETKRYPSVFVLSGFTGRGRMQLNDSAFSPNFAARMDSLINSGVIRPMIAVLPDCFTRFGGSQYVNSTATGNYEDYLTNELVPFVDEHVATIQDRDARGVMGKSSGGYGALVMAMRHSDIFGLVCSTAGDAYFEHCYLADFPKAFRAINGDPEALVAKFWDEEARKSKDDFAGLNIIGMSACYSPNGAGFDLPFDPNTCEIRDDVWQRWLAHDPVRLMEKSVENLNSLRLLFIDAGKRDEFALDFGARILCDRLRAHDIRHVHEEFDDGHFNISYRQKRSLELLSENFAV